MGAHSQQLHRISYAMEELIKACRMELLSTPQQHPDTSVNTNILNNRYLSR